MKFFGAFLEDTTPSHINSEQFFVNIHHILNDNSCLITNINVLSTVVFDRITQTLTSVFGSNILLAHTNTIENARVIISENELSLKPLFSRAKIIKQAKRFEMETHFEFSLSDLISLAYCGLFNKERLNN